jgi:hypothetical protein
MLKTFILKQEFVEYIPGELSDGVVYVSIPFATAVHKCACGCGNEVITPLSPTDWRLTFDGKTISLQPSIGNWNFPCQSHYWIFRNQVRWAPRMARSDIEAGRRRDRRGKEAYFERGEIPVVEEDGLDTRAASQPLQESFWQGVKRRILSTRPRRR